MKKVLFVAISIIFLLPCCVERHNKDESFYVCVSLGGDTRSGKDYIKCWIDDSLLFSGIYRDKYNDTIQEYVGEYLGMELPNAYRFKKENIRVKLRFISLDSVLFAGKKVVDTTFLYQVNNIPGIAVSYIRPYCRFLVWDTLRTPDYFEYEY